MPSASGCRASWCGRAGRTRRRPASSLRSSASRLTARKPCCRSRTACCIGMRARARRSDFSFTPPASTATSSAPASISPCLACAARLPNRSRRCAASPATRSPAASAANRTRWWRGSSPAGRAGSIPAARWRWAFRRKPRSTRSSASISRTNWAARSRLDARAQNPSHGLEGGVMGAAMRFPSTLIPATLARRYKRFLADVVLENGDMLTVHVANPGAMTGLDRPFSRVWLSNSENPMRKLPFNWELVEVDFGNGLELVGVNTSPPNVLVADVLETGLIPQLRDYPSVRREVKYGLNSRFDFLLEGPGRRGGSLEVKNVHLIGKRGLAEFPDCVTARGAKHLDELTAAVASGARAVLLFVIQIPSAERFAVARDIDPAYAAAFDRAPAGGVEMLAWRCAVTVDSIEIAAPVPIVTG